MYFVYILKQKKKFQNLILLIHFICCSLTLNGEYENHFFIFLFYFIVTYQLPVCMFCFSFVDDDDGVKKKTRQGQDNNNKKIFFYSHKETKLQKIIFITIHWIIAHKITMYIILLSLFLFFFHIFISHHIWWPKKKVTKYTIIQKDFLQRDNQH